MSTDAKPKHSPAPWTWRPEQHSRNVLIAADGDTIALYDEAYLRPRGEADAVNRALIAAAPDMAALLREIEFSGSDCNSGYCPECVATKGSKHEPDCKLGAIIARIGMAVTPRY